MNNEKREFEFRFHISHRGMAKDGDELRKEIEEKLGISLEKLAEVSNHGHMFYSHTVSTLKQFKTEVDELKILASSISGCMDNLDKPPNRRKEIKEYAIRMGSILRRMNEILEKDDF